MVAHISTCMNGTASTMIAGSCPVTCNSGPISMQMVIATKLAANPAQAAMRTDRRTARTACLRRPSSAAINGDAAPTNPVRLHTSRPNSDTVSDEAASDACPSRDTNTTSSANTAICNKLAATSGPASPSVARHSA